jgi:predicted DCC family thiol-disulfide oxidoreductase YuxK
MKTPNPDDIDVSAARRDGRPGATAPGDGASAWELVLYDGGCGLCHGAVRWLLRRDRDGSRFRFAPLDGETARQRLPAERRASLPDSLVVLTRDGRLLVRWRAVRHAAGRLGGGWRLLAGLAAVVPARLGDWLYDRVARLRHRLAPRPTGSCPILPAAQRARVLP